MTKRFPCDVDCAACAAKLEDAIRKVDGVEDARVNALTRRLTLTAAEERFEAVVAAVLKTAKRVDPDTVITVK